MLQVRLLDVLQVRPPVLECNRVGGYVLDKCYWLFSMKKKKVLRVRASGETPKAKQSKQKLNLALGQCPLERNGPFLSVGNKLSSVSN